MQKRWITLIAVLALTTTIISANVGGSSGRASTTGFSGYVNLLSIKTTGLPAVAWSPDASRVAVGDDTGFLSIYDSASGSLIKTFKAHDASTITAVSWSRLGKLATGSSDNTVKIWDTTKWEQVGDPIKNHTDRIWDVAWSFDGNVLATAGRDGKAFTYNPDGKYLMKMKMPPSGSYQTLALAWQPSGNEIVGVVKDENKDETVLYKWYTASGDIAKEFKLAVNAFDATWDPDGKTVVVALQNGTLMLISADVFTPKKFLIVNPVCKLNVVMWGDETQKDEVVTAGNDTSIYTLNVTSGAVTPTPNAHTDIIKRLVLSPNGTMYASGGFDNLVKIWGESHPHVVWHIPANGARDVSVKANITIKFDRKMVESILSTSIRLYTAQINVVVKNNNTVAVIEPQGDLAYEATYNVIVAASAKGLVGGNMTSDYSFTFKTEVKPSGPALDIPWLWVGVAVLVIFIIIIIAVLASRRRAGKRIMPQRRRSEDERR